MSNRILFVFAVISFSIYSGCSGCGLDRDAELRKEVIGTWKQDTTDVVLFYNFKEDGTFTCSMEGKGVIYGLVTSANKLMGANEYGGFWTVEQGCLKRTFTGNTNVAADAFQKLVGAVDKAITGEDMSIAFVKTDTIDYHSNKLWHDKTVLLERVR